MSSCSFETDAIRAPPIPDRYSEYTASKSQHGGQRITVSRRLYSLPLATNKRFRERGGKWRLCSSSKTIVYWIERIIEREPTNYANFHEILQIVHMNIKTWTTTAVTYSVFDKGSR